MAETTLYFVLRNINTEEIDRKYGISISSNITENSEIPKNSTKLSDIIQDNNNMPNSVSFMDEIKRLHKCDVSTIDLKTCYDVKTLRYNCYWCRHPFDTVPFGCPIQYVSNKTVKTYYSEISKDTYTIKENITKKRLESISKDDVSPEITKSGEPYYITDGIFCSFNCIIAFIDDNKHNIMYANSKVLLNKLYKDVTGKRCEIEHAPHWRLLQQYGGKLSINEFRSSFNNIEYVFQGYEFPKSKLDISISIGTLFEKKIKF
jgi:hypothetical protein